MRKTITSIVMYGIFVFGYCMLIGPSIDIIHNIYYLFMTLMLYLFQVRSYPSRIFLMQRFETFEDACFYFIKSHLFNLLYFLLPLFILTVVAFMFFGIAFDGIQLMFYFIHLGLIFGFIGFGVLFDLMENKKSMYKYGFATYIGLSFLMGMILNDIPIIQYLIITIGLTKPLCFMGIAIHALLMIGVFEKRKQKWFL